MTFRPEELWFLACVGYIQATDEEVYLRSTAKLSMVGRRWPCRDAAHGMALSQHIHRFTAIFRSFATLRAV